MPQLDGGRVMAAAEQNRSALEGGQRRRGFFGSRRAAVAGHETSGLDELEAEIALLREDNARLRLSHAQVPDAGRLVERMRVLVEQRPDGAWRHPDDQCDEVWQLLSEAMLVRNVLIDVCAEIAQVVVGLQSRLDEMLPPEPGVADADYELPDRAR